LLDCDAKGQNPHNAYFGMDFLNSDYWSKFDLILPIYCDFAFLGEDERKKLLGIAFKALKKGGCLVFDLNTLKFCQNQFQD
jgi:hypothetical protein